MAGRHMSRCHGGGTKGRQNFAGTYRAGKSRFRRFDDLEAPCSRASPSPESLQNPPEKGRKPPRRCGLALAGSAAGRSRLGGGSARLANPQRRCAAGMSRRARPVGHRRKPKDAPCFKALKQCLEKWSHLTFNASFTVRNARFTVRNARFTFKNATPANESYPAGYTRTSVYQAGYDSRERASQRARSAT